VRSNPNEPGPEHERAEKSTGESDPKVSRKGPTFEGRADESKWQRLRRSYVEGDRSLRALSDEHCVPYATAKRRAKKEAWAVKRATFRQELDRQLDKAALVSRAQVYEIQEQAARETVAIFARVFAAKAREIRADPAAKNAANGLSRLIQLQLDVCELGLTILGDIELGARAAGYSSPHSSQISLRGTP